MKVGIHYWCFFHIYNPYILLHTINTRTLSWKNMQSFCSFFKRLYNNNNIYDLVWNLQIEHRDSKSNAHNSHGFKTILFVNQWINFFIRLIHWIFLNFTPLYLSSKTFSISTVLSFVYANNSLIYFDLTGSSDVFLLEMQVFTETE